MTAAEGLSSPGLDPGKLRKTFAHFPSGVTGVCAFIDAGPVGMAASSFAPVSLDPPLVLFCAARTSLTWPLLRHAPELGISVLGDQQEALCRQLAGRPEERFLGVEWSRTEHGAVLLEGATAWLACQLEDEVAAGDHSVVVLRVNALSSAPARRPLIFYQSRLQGLGR